MALSLVACGPQDDSDTDFESDKSRAVGTGKSASGKKCDMLVTEYNETMSICREELKSASDGAFTRGEATAICDCLIDYFTDRFECSEYGSASYSEAQATADYCLTKLGYL